LLQTMISIQTNVLLQNSLDYCYVELKGFDRLQADLAMVDDSSRTKITWKAERIFYSFESTKLMTLNTLSMFHFQYKILFNLVRNLFEIILRYIITKLYLLTKQNKTKKVLISCLSWINKRIDCDCFVEI
jgi:hypothetical protein